MARIEIATDAFTYSNGSLSTVSGGNWGELSTSGGYGAVAVTSNTAVGPGYGANSPAARWIGAGTFTDNQYAAIDINFAGATGSGADFIMGVVLRATADQDATRDYYYGYVEDSWPNDARLLRIGKIVNGTNTSLGTVSSAAFGGTGTVRFTLEAETSGADVLLRAYAGASETPVLSVTDNSGTRLFGGLPGVKSGSENTILGDNWAGGNLGGGAAVPNVTSAGDDSFYAGETGVVLTGTGFGATQGGGSVILSPTNDPDDVNAVAQTVTSWGDTSITITVVRGTLSLDTNLYLFVTNDGAAVNASGYVVQIQARVFVREILIDKFGAPVASESGIVMLVWRQAPTTGAPNPDQAITVSTNGSGEVDQAVARGALALNDPILVSFFKSGSPVRSGVRWIVPDYE